MMKHLSLKACFIVGWLGDSGLDYAVRSARLTAPQAQQGTTTYQLMGCVNHAILGPVEEWAPRDTSAKVTPNELADTCKEIISCSWQKKVPYTLRPDQMGSAITDHVGKICGVEWTDEIEDAYDSDDDEYGSTAIHSPRPLRGSSGWVKVGRDCGVGGQDRVVVPPVIYTGLSTPRLHPERHLRSFYFKWADKVEGILIDYKDSFNCVTSHSTMTCDEWSKLVNDEEDGSTKCMRGYVARVVNRSCGKAAIRRDPKGAW